MTMHGWEMFISVVYLLSSTIRWMVMMFCPLQEFALAHHDTWRMLYRLILHFLFPLLVLELCC